MGPCRPHIGLEGARSRPRSRPRVARVDLESTRLGKYTDYLPCFRLHKPDYYLQCYSTEHLYTTHLWKQSPPAISEWSTAGESEFCLLRWITGVQCCEDDICILLLKMCSQRVLHFVLWGYKRASALLLSCSPDQESSWLPLSAEGIWRVF